MIDSEKKKLLILIDSLKRGGAETMLVNLLPALNDFFHFYALQRPWNAGRLAKCKLCCTDGVAQTDVSKVEGHFNIFGCYWYLCILISSLRTIMWARVAGNVMRIWPRTGPWWSEKKKWRRFLKRSKSLFVLGANPISSAPRLTVCDLIGRVSWDGDGGRLVMATGYYWQRFEKLLVCIECADGDNQAGWEIEAKQDLALAVVVRRCGGDLGICVSVLSWKCVESTRDVRTAINIH